MSEFEMGGCERLEITPEVLDPWRQYQDELARHGVSYEAKLLDFMIWQALKVVPGVGELPEDELHASLSRPAHSTDADDAVGSVD